MQKLKIRKQNRLKNYDYSLNGILIINKPVGTAPTKEGCEAGTALSSNKNTRNNKLSIIIGSFKSAVTRQINQINLNGNVHFMTI